MPGTVVTGTVKPGMTIAPAVKPPLVMPPLAKPGTEVAAIMGLLDHSVLRDLLCGLGRVFVALVRPRRLGIRDA